MTHVFAQVGSLAALAAALACGVVGGYYALANKARHQEGEKGR